VDILLGIPESGSEPLAKTLRTLVKYAPTHVSVYCLEGGGDVGDRVQQFLSRVDEDDAAKEYLSTCAALKKEGFVHYEVSNFALPGRESAHNRAYWDGDDYLGIGPAAHSYLGERRWFNPPSLDLYLTGMELGFEENREEDVRDDKKRELERLILGLRTDRGVPSEMVGCAPEEIRELETRDLVSIVNDHVILTDRGFLLLDEIAIRFSRKE
jgi:oxygen-independent coproporphyrinogen-3 oxidase